MFIHSKPYNSKVEPKISAFYFLMTEIDWYPALHEAIDKGWGENFNECEPVNHASLLVNYLGSLGNLLERHPNEIGKLGETKENPEGEAVAVKLVDKGANPWLATTIQPFYTTINYYSQQKQSKPDFEERIDGFDQAVHTGCSELVDVILQQNEQHSDKLGKQTKDKQPRQQPEFNQVELRELTQRGAIVYNHHGQGRRRLPYIHATVHHGMVKTAQVLLKHGFSVEQVDEEGRTPLFYAPNVETLEFLLANGAKAIVKDRQEKLPSAHWKETLAPSTSNEMGRRYQEALLDKVGDLGGEEKLTVVRKRALEILAKGQRSALTKLAKGAGIDLKTLTFPSKIRNREESLLYRASMILLDKENIPFHGVAMGLELGQGLTETIAGIPDAFWAYRALKQGEDRVRKGEVQTLAESMVIEYCKSHPWSTTGLLDERLEKLWVTKASGQIHEKAMKRLEESFSSFKETPTEQEQQLFGLSKDPLYLQFTYNLIIQGYKNSTDLMQSFVGNQYENDPKKVSQDKTIRDLLIQSPLFWRSLQYAPQGLKHNPWHFRRNTTEMWKIIQTENIPAPVGLITKNEISKILQEGGVSEVVEPDVQPFAKAWLNKWLLKEAEQEVLSQSEPNQPKSSTPKMRL